MAYACNYCADTKRVKYQNFDGTTSEGHCPNCSAIAADGSPLSLSTPAVKPDFIFAAEKRREWGLRMLERDGRDMVSSLRMFSQAISLHNALWEIDIETGEQLKPNVDQMFMLIISEISEAFEGYRKNLLDTHLKHRSAMEAELADALVRILHMGVRFGLDVPGAAVEKCLYNVTRPDHQYEARIANHGKKF